MRIDEKQRLLIRYNEIVPEVFSKSAYDMARHTGKIVTTHRGGSGRPVEIIFEKCSNSYQRKIVKKLGNPYLLVIQEEYQTPSPEEVFVEKLKQEAIKSIGINKAREKFKEIFGIEDYYNGEITGCNLSKPHPAKFSQD